MKKYLGIIIGSLSLISAIIILQPISLFLGGIGVAIAGINLLFIINKKDIEKEDDNE